MTTNHNNKAHSFSKHQQKPQKRNRQELAQWLMVYKVNKGIYMYFRLFMYTRN